MQIAQFLNKNEAGKLLDKYFKYVSIGKSNYLKLSFMPKHLSNFFNQTLIKRRDNYWDQKDPSPVRVPDKYDPTKAMYHIYGTRGDDRTRVWEVFHAISKDPHGPWTELEPIQTGIRGAGVAAPGVVYDDADGRVHMFVQTEFLALDGTIEYLTSDDGG
jgi:hypothetical protein